MKLQYQLLHTPVDAGLEGILAEHVVAETRKLETREVLPDTAELLCNTQSPFSDSMSLVLSPRQVGGDQFFPQGI